MRRPRARASCRYLISHQILIPYTFWAGLIGGTFFTTASHGTDQLIVQRLLAARGQKQSATALISSGVAVLFQFALFLTVGHHAVGVLPGAVGNVWAGRTGFIRRLS